ncbi:MAG TPA: hypothetical protein DEP66_06420 [Acidimicrobiaceae bacterium]|nr:hypothetical protein [Acidimicrobiaceae bacterium]
MWRSRRALLGPTTEWCGREAVCGLAWPATAYGRPADVRPDVRPATSVRRSLSGGAVALPRLRDESGEGIRTMTGFPGSGLLRRPAAVLSAAALCASLLAVVPAVSAAAGDREFGGSDGYETAVMLADRFVDTARGDGEVVDTVVVASGDSAVDALAAASLASHRNAPVVVVGRDELPEPVAEFVRRRALANVVIVGGTRAVSAKVAAALAALEPVERVERVAGADRFDTAAAVGAASGEAGDWCDDGRPAAVLVNGIAFADAAAIGSPVYAMGLPLLLTHADRLPAATARFLVDAEIEHVVVVGGTAVVSAAVVDAVADTGVDEVTRIAGADRYDTSVAVLEALVDCGAKLDGIALVNGESPADGLPAAPALGRGLDGSGTTAMIFVRRDELPEKVATWLRDSKSEDGREITITPVGDVEAVSEEVVTAAVSAARQTAEPQSGEPTANFVERPPSGDADKEEDLRTSRQSSAPTVVIDFAEAETHQFTITVTGAADGADGTVGLPVLGEGYALSDLGELELYRVGAHEPHNFRHPNTAVYPTSLLRLSLPPLITFLDDASPTTVCLFGVDEASSACRSDTGFDDYYTLENFEDDPFVDSEEEARANGFWRVGNFIAGTETTEIRPHWVLVVPAGAVVNDAGDGNEEVWANALGGPGCAAGSVLERRDVAPKTVSYDHDDDPDTAEIAVTIPGDSSAFSCAPTS